ncbi:MAG: electron transport complex subunit RsxC [Andreesenia angusta]|nr:electron transport complex subunit RsxC [Andreesenia angusta]
MKLASLTFSGGIHPPYRKGMAQSHEIRPCSDPETVTILLRQHIGAPCEPLVKVGDEVKVGQKIGDTEAFVSAPIHSSVSGKVSKIMEVDSPDGTSSNAVVIKSDGLFEISEEVKPKGDIDNLSSKEIIDIVREAGITGQGGASFPTHIKLVPPKDKEVDIVILNGAECEPYLTADHRLMLEKSEDIIYGLKAIMKAVGVNKGYIGIEDNKMDAIDSMREAAKNESNIEIVALETKYPQGDEKRIIDAITKRRVPSGGLPMDVGVVVNNVGTAYAISVAIKTGMPLIERIVTVTGGALEQPSNFMVRIGTPFSSLIEDCGGYKGEVEKLVMGGPMMGMAQFTDSVPVVKGTSGVLALSKAEAALPEQKQCIRCAKCVEVCPVKLEPVLMNQNIMHERFDELEKLNIWSCIECGACSFVCPSKISLVHSFKYAKKELAKRKSN